MSLEKPRSITPSMMPTAIATAMTMIDRRTVSWRDGQVTRRNSANASEKYRKVRARRAASGLMRLAELEILAHRRYRTSRCILCDRHLGQNFFSSRRSGSFRRFLLDEYVRSRQSVQPSVMSERASPLRAIA